MFYEIGDDIKFKIQTTLFDESIIFIIIFLSLLGILKNNQSPLKIEPLTLNIFETIIV
jgi:hypothetical protein